MIVDIFGCGVISGKNLSLSCSEAQLHLTQDLGVDLESVQVCNLTSLSYSVG